MVGRQGSRALCEGRIRCRGVKYVELQRLATRKNLPLGPSQDNKDKHGSRDTGSARFHRRDEFAMRLFWRACNGCHYLVLVSLAADQPGLGGPHTAGISASCAPTCR